LSYKPVDVIEVFAWGRRVGAVALDPSTGWYAFAYDPEWVADGVELAPLHMPLRVEPYQFPGLPRETFHGLPPMLADALPDAFGNALVDRWMAEHSVAPGAITALDRLAYASNRAMGALEFHPPARSEQDDAPTAVQLADLVLAARGVVQGDLSTDENARMALRELIHVGTSAGGARPKAIVAFNPQTSQIRSPYGTEVEGFEQWLIKLDGVSSHGLDGHGSDLGEGTPYGRIEYAYFLMAQAAEIDMMPCRLLAEGPRRHFMTMRFDRGSGGERIHVMSLCAMAHLDFNLVGAHSYDQYLQTVSLLNLGAVALQQAFRRMVFNVMAVNRDDHTKNFSFLRRKGGPWELAPAFDMAHAYRPDSVWNQKHLMSVNGKFEDIALDDLLAVGDRHNVPGFKRAIREVRAAVDRWEEFAGTVELPEEARARILGDIDRFRPL
jgi:serine/threonine-protein kinase HipA